MTTSVIENPLSFPPATTNWADKLLTFGLFIFAFACNFSISASQTGLGLALIGCIAMIKQGRLRIRPTPLDAPFAFLALSGLLSAFQADEVVKALTEMKSYLIIVVFYLAFWPRMQQGFQQKLLYTFVFSAALVSLVNNYQILSGFTESRHTKGFFSMCITFGECMSMAGLTTLVMLATNDKGRWRFLLLFIALGLISSSMIQTLTRGAWIGFAAGAVVLAIRFPRRLIPFLLVFSILGTAAAMQNSHMQERLSGLNPFKTLATAGQSIDAQHETNTLYANLQRMYIWKHGFTMAAKTFSFGVGQRNVKTHYKKLASQYETEKNLIWGHQHNNFMQMLAMNGFLGLTAFSCFLIATCRFLLKKAEGQTISSLYQLHSGAIGIFIGFIAFGLTEYVWGDEEVTMMALFLVGLLMNRESPVNCA